jgi:hypothetical protein
MGAKIVYHQLVARRQVGWGATDTEGHGPLPGDDLVAEPADQVTRGITIEAPRDLVWPWVVQLGADRGGFYSYDWLENAFGLGIHSAEEIVPEWQQRQVGDLVCANRKGTGGWYVVDLRPNDALVLKMANVKAARPARRADPWSWEFLWTFALQERPDGSTRLLVRERAAFGRRTTRFLMAPISLVSFVMTRKMLLGIKSRAETTARRRDADAPRHFNDRADRSDGLDPVSTDRGTPPPQRADALHI